MKNFGKFKKELRAMDASSENLDEELKALKQELSGLAAERAPSEQAQRWAWTRLEAHMMTPSHQSEGFGWIRALGWCVMAFVAIWIVGAVYNPVVGLAPKITFTDPDMNAVYFYSKDPGADVIWISGYDYLPQDYVIR